jgi:hypothetical protein
VGDIEQLGDADLRQILQREAPPLFFLPGRERSGLESLERGEAVFEQPGRLSAPNTEPLDRCAVERQWRRGDWSEGQPIAPSIWSWMRRFISIA